MDNITSNNQIRINYTVAHLRWGVIAKHSHQENSCITYLTCLSLFNGKVLLLLNNVNDKVFSNLKD